MAIRNHEFVHCLVNKELFITFKNKQLRLTNGECISVIPSHYNNMIHGGDFRRQFLCVSNDDKRAIICSYNGNQIGAEKSNCSEGGLDFHLHHFRLHEETEPEKIRYCMNVVNLVGNYKLGPIGTGRGGGGGEEFLIDPTSGKVFMKPLVLGKRHDGTIELVYKDDRRALRVKNVKGTFSRSRYFELDDGAFIGRKWNTKKRQKITEFAKSVTGIVDRNFEWNYFDLCVTNDQDKALKFTYDGQFIDTEYQGSMTVALPGWSYSRGRHLVCVDCPNTGRTRLADGGGDFCFYPDGQIGIKPLALGKFDKEVDGVKNRLVMVDPDSPQVIKLDIDYLLSETVRRVQPKIDSDSIEIKNRRIQELESQINELVQKNEILKEENKGTFENKELRLTSGEYISVAPHHVNKFGSYEDWRWYDLCISTDNKRAIICSYDGNFLESQTSQCTEAGFAFNLTFWRYEKGNIVNLVKNQQTGCRDRGGGRDFQVDLTSGKVFLKPLVLGKRADGIVELVPKNDERALHVRCKNIDDMMFSESKFLELSDGQFIGRKSNDKITKWMLEVDDMEWKWEYIDLCVTNDRNKALKCTYDGQFIATDYQGEMVFGLSDSLRVQYSHSDLMYKQGNTVVCVNGSTTARTRLNGGGRDFCFYPDGQIGIKPLALGKAEIEIDAVDVQEKVHKVIGLKNRLVTVDPDSPQVIKLDIDYLFGETVRREQPKIDSDPIEIKNRKTQELESQINELVQKNEILKKENKGIQDLKIQIMKLERQNSKLISQEPSAHNLPSMRLLTCFGKRKVKPTEKDLKSANQTIEDMKADTESFLSGFHAIHKDPKLSDLAIKLASDNIKLLEVITKL